MWSLHGSHMPKTALSVFHETMKPTGMWGTKSAYIRGIRPGKLQAVISCATDMCGYPGSTRQKCTSVPIRKMLLTMSPFLGNKTTFFRINHY